jgi:phosphoribosylamine--glycine ligase
VSIRAAERILIVGSGAREHAIAAALARSPQKPVLFNAGPARNPGIVRLCEVYAAMSATEVAKIVAFAREQKITMAIPGPEAPLAAGVVDALEAAGIPCVGPRQSPARIESSKGFARDLIAKHGIRCNPRFQRFASMDGVAAILDELGEQVVVKDDGLAGGKGVKVYGDHLHSRAECEAFCAELVAAGHPFVIEEKLEGEEFSLLSFCDGHTLAHMPAVQDHKRAFAGDMGPNTGGMGAYTDASGSLPFLRAEDIQAAHHMNQLVAAALEEECGAAYRGVLYGGFMATAEGVRVIEYNARFGDPECLNLLTLLQTDFVAVCRAIVEGTLADIAVSFRKQASVCKYIVPGGYPEAPRVGDRVEMPRDAAAVTPRDAEGVTLYDGAVEEREGAVFATGSRAVGIVSTAATMAAAEEACERVAKQFSAPFFHREDIGTAALIAKRVEHMQRLRAGTTAREDL